MKDSTFKASASSHLRIADVLLMDEEEEEEPSFPGGGCMGPVSRCLSRVRRPKAKRALMDNKRCSTNLLNKGHLVTAPVTNQSGGECRREASFNLGVGCYLLHLIAASKKELDRMTELRTQMENLVRNVKEELRVKDGGVVNVCESNDVYAYSTTDVAEGLECDDQISLLNRTVSPESLTMKVCDKPTPEGMDQLEAELEAELERLQLHLDRERLLQHGELEREEETVKDTASASQSLSYGDVIDPVTDPQEACSEIECGVPPYELERRLHEVLETRQQEQIRELEAALECARYKLHEKEMEISWWKDTARLMFEHVARSPRLMSELSQEP